MTSWVVVIALALTGVAWWYAHQMVDTANSERFQAESARLQGMIMQRMQGHEMVLWGGVAMMNGSEDVSRDEWATYVSSLSLTERWPGVEGFGLATPSGRTVGDASETADRAAPAGAGATVVFLEPRTEGTEGAIGVDLGDDPALADALDRARDTGDAVASAIVEPGGGGPDDQRWFALIAPVYEREVELDDVDDRRAALLGWIYTSLGLDSLMEQRVGRPPGSIDIELYLGDDPRPETLLFDHDPTLPATEGDRLHRQVTVSGPGQPLTMAFRAGPDFATTAGALPTVVSVAGLLITGLLVLVVRSYRRFHGRATQLVAARTAALEASNHELARRSNLLEAQTAELQRSNDELRQFARVVSHDLQAPLRTMASYSSLVTSTYQDRLEGDGQRWLAYISGAAKRQSGLIRDLLQFMSLDRLNGEPDPVDLNDVMDVIARDLSSLFVAESADLTVEQLPVVVGDAGQLQRLLGNLVHNAVRHQRPGVATRVVVGATPVDDGNGAAAGWRIHVRDNGPGIDPELRERVFDVFHQPDPASTTGTGMGLAICRKIARAHGGEIGIMASADGGSDFWFTLPAAGATARSEPDGLTTGDGRDSGGRRGGGGDRSDRAESDPGPASMRTTVPVGAMAEERR
ncbi:MAG: CHASE domain-containing protein [Actinomycetota bacterium]